MILGASLEGQKEISPIPSDTIAPEIIEAAFNPVDSLPKAQGKGKLRVSKDSIESKIEYGARDTQWIDVKKNEAHLIGDAYVFYEEYKIKAGYIILNLDKHEALAEGIENLEGGIEQRPTFSDGKQELTYGKLRYNFETKKGIVYEVITQEGEFFVHGKRTKYVSAEADTITHEDRIYQKNALITTCNHDPPHYAIRTTKLKMIPDRVAVMGPANLEIAGVPTPLFIPFGFFPILKGKTSGIIFPDDYEYSERFGFGLRKFGYYYALNDYVDLSVLGDIYTRGSHGISFLSSYKKRYSYTGSINLAYSNFLEENTIDGSNNSTKSLSLRVSHNQDSKAHPYRKFGGSINITTGSYDRLNFNNANAVLNRSLSSDFSFSHSLPGTPFRMSAAFRHRQDVINETIDITFPELNLNMNTIFPFKRKLQTGGEKWYEKISLKYDSQVKSRVRTQDSLLFTDQVWDDFQYGVEQRATSNASFRALKYINISPRVNYRETWYFTSNERFLNTEPIIDTTVVDTDLQGMEILSFDTTYVVEEEVVNGFKPFRTFDFSLTANTQLFNTRTFKRGPIRGIRHVMKPSLSFNYSPDTRARYQEMVDTDIRPDLNDPLEYNPFVGGVFSAPSLREQQASINLSIANNFEAKYFSKKDSTEKKFKLFDNLTVNGGYNFAADSLNWNPVTARGAAKLFGGYTTISLSATWNPYIRENNQVVNKLALDERGKILNLENFSATFSTRASVKQIRDIFRSKEKSGKSGQTKSGRGANGSSTFKKQNEESILDLIDNFSISHNIVLSQREFTGQDSFFISTHSIVLRGSIKLTPNWDIQLGNISYDFKSDRFIYPTLGLSRDLHCWNMTLGWYPAQQSYSFFIGVKSSALNFLKYNYGQNQFDGRSNPF